MKTVYDLHRFWTSMSAIFGFTFHIGRMTEALTPDIYIELTAFPFEIVGSILATDSYEKILQRCFSGHFGFLPQGMFTGWVRINLIRKLIS